MLFRHHDTVKCLSFLCIGALSTSIFIKNAGFEDDGPLPDNTYQYDSSILADWSDYDPNNIMALGNTGIQNPTGGTSFNDPIFGSDSPEGSICCYVEQDTNSNTGDGLFGIQQTLSIAIQPDTTYTLSVYVGNTDDNCWSQFSTDGVDCYSSSGSPGYVVQLVSGTTVLAQDDDSLVIPDGEWRESIVTVNIYTGNTYIGQALTIRLMNKNLDTGEVVFDDVQLEAVKHTSQPTESPTKLPTKPPTRSPSKSPLTSQTPTNIPSHQPTPAPSKAPTGDPTLTPTLPPTLNPSKSPTMSPFSTETPTENTIASSLSFDYISTDHDGSTGGANDKETDEEQQGSRKYSLNYGVFALIIAGGIVAALVVICCVMKQVKQQEKPTTRTSTQDNEWTAMWLKNIVKLAQYEDNFVGNGFENIKTVASIVDKEQLVEIGIHTRGHQTLLMAEIEKLRHSEPKSRNSGKVKHPKAPSKKNMEGNIKDRVSIPQMIMLQSLSPASSSAAIQRSSSVINVFVEEVQEEMEDDDVIMNDIVMHHKGTFTKKGDEDEAVQGYT
eukprot:113031_1